MCIETCYKFFEKKYNDQDFMQKIVGGTTFVFEMVRVLFGSFLVVFVPQKCGSHMCNLTEKLYTDDIIYKIGFTSNVITLIAFTTIYMIEGRRETLLIKYLHVNNKKPTDGETIGKILEILPNEKKDKILRLDNLYKKTTNYAIMCFILNTIICGFVVFDNYLNNKTITTYISNVLFMITKLYDIHYTSYTEPNIFFSAYLKNKIQYNDIDPKYLIKLQTLKTFESVILEETEKTNKNNNYFTLNIEEYDDISKII